MSQIFNNLESHRGHIEQVRENATRPGRVFQHYRTVGSGNTVETTVFDFGCAFISVPVFTFGGALDEDQMLDQDDDPPDYSSGVYRWRKNSHGFYTGAWCWFNVSYFGSNVETFGLNFSLVWEGVASKDFITTPGFPVNKLDR